MKRGLIVIVLIIGLIAFGSLPPSQADAANGKPHSLRSENRLHSLPQAVSYTFTKIADDAGPFHDFFADPAINDDGVVAFAANLDAGGNTIVKGEGGPLTTIADLTTNVPGLGTFTSLDGSNFSINSEGVVAFRGGCCGSPGLSGIFTGSGTQVSVIALNDPLINPVLFFSPFITNSGDVFMVSNVPSIHVSRGGGPPVLLYDNSGLPDLPFDFQNIFGGLSANQAGTAAFLTGILGSTGGSFWFAFSGNGGTLTPISDLSILGVRDFVSTSINNHGTVAFTSGRNFGTTTIYTGNGGPLTIVADNLGPYGILAPNGAAINDGGTVVFSADFDTNPGTGGAGIFRGPDPVADKVIGIGDPLDGSAVRFVRCGRHSLNNAGQIAFTASLSDGTQRVFRADPVTPNSAPIARCQDVTVSAETNCMAAASVDNLSSDPDGDSITVTQTPPGPYSPGTTSVTLIVTDPLGASSQCSANVTVVDATPSAITCSSNITQIASLGPNGAAVNYAAATATDNCQVASINCVPPSGSAFPVGATTVNCTANDAAGNTASCGFTVTVRTPQQATQQIVNNVISLVKQGRLNPFQGILLIARLQVVVQLMNRGLSNVAILQLRIFIADVNFLINSGQLSQAYGQPLIAAANEIIASLGP